MPGTSPIGRAGARTLVIHQTSAPDVTWVSTGRAGFWPQPAKQAVQLIAILPAEPPVSAQQRLRRDEPDQLHPPEEQPGRGGDNRAADAAQLRFAVLPRRARPAPPRGGTRCAAWLRRPPCHRRRRTAAWSRPGR